MTELYRIATTWTSPQGGPYITQMYFRVGEIFNGDIASIAVADFWTSIGAQFSDNMAWTVDPTALVIEDTDGSIVGSTAVTGDTGTGGGAGDMLPYTTQALVRWRSGVYEDGREIRGRTFVPGINEGGNVDGTCPSAVQAVLNTAAEDLIATENAAFCIWRRPRVDHPTLPDRAGSNALVVTGSAWNQWAVLRSRRD